MKAKTGSAIYRPDLGQAVMEFYETEVTDFIGLQVMPLFPTAVQAASYPVIPKEAMLKLFDTSRAPRAKYKRDDFEYERGKFATSEQGWEEPVDDSERNLLDQEAPGLSDIIATKRAMGMIMRNQEKRIADAIFNATNFTANSVTTEWNTAASATPLDDVLDGIASFRSQCGMKPDALIISYTTFLDLKACDQIVDQIKYTFPGIDILSMGASQLAQLFGVPRVLIGGGVYDSKGKGIDSTIADLWSYEYAMLCKIGSGRDIMQPCVGRTFLWTADSPSNAIVEEYREEQTRSDVYRVRHHVSEELLKSYDSSGTVVSNISGACGYLLSNIHT
jgi:hypothetical protein